MGWIKDARLCGLNVRMSYNSKASILLTFLQSLLEMCLFVCVSLAILYSSAEQNVILARIIKLTPVDFIFSDRLSIKPCGFNCFVASLSVCM